MNRLVELEHKRREVSDLRIHYSCERQKLSRTLKDLIDFCQQNSPSDPLIHRVKDNKFVEKRWICSML
ncbi:hypothetical protein CLF_110550 [Clonorchis sinensis]|uniref:G protein gamma domain-containing protein n=1 Tax=Clonorchis sinensis TaxID=79923 RepID=G7YKU6_CLOSI|nr:hypothetical protein CLF_110550 [Clonorchis sinensis]